MSNFLNISNNSVGNAQQIEQNQVVQTETAQSTPEIDAGRPIAQKTLQSQRSEETQNLGEGQSPKVRTDSGGINIVASALNAPLNLKLERISLAMQSSVPSGLGELNSYYEDASPAKQEALDTKLATLFADSLAPQSHLESLSHRAAQEVVEKFFATDTTADKDSIKDTFAEMVCEQVKMLEEATTDVAREQALSQLEASYQLMLANDMPQDLLDSIKNLQEVAGHYGNMTTQQATHTRLECVITDIINASDINSVATARQALQNEFMTMGGRSLDTHTQSLFNTLTDISLAKTERLQSIAERQAILDRAIKTQDVELIDSLSTDSSIQEKTLVGRAGQSGLDAQEDRLLAGIRNLKESNTVMQTITSLRNALPEDVQEALNTLLQNTHYNADICTALASLQNSSNPSRLSHLLKSIGTAQKEASLANCKVAFDAINSLFMDTSINPSTGQSVSPSTNQATGQSFDPSVALALKTSLVPTGASGLAIKAFMDTQHSAILSCKTINQCLTRDGQGTQDIKTAESVRKLLNKDPLPTNADGESIEILLLSAYYQLAKAEKLATGESFDVQADFYAHLADDKQDLAKSYVEGASHLGFMTETQIKAFQTSLDRAQKISDLGALRNMLLSLRDDKAKMQDSISRLAARLEIPTHNADTSEKTLQELLTACAQKFDVVLAQAFPQMTMDTEHNKAVEFIQDFKTSSQRANTTLQAMVQAQKLSSSEDISGETLGYSMLLLQKLLVRDIRSLSAHDLQLVGLSTDDFANEESYTQALNNSVESLFGARKSAEDRPLMIGGSGWQQALLLAAYSQLPHNKYQEYCEQDKIPKALQKVTAEALQRQSSPFSEAEVTSVLQSLNISGNSLRINLTEGRSYIKASVFGFGKALGDFDPAGRVLRTLVQSLASADGTQGVSLERKNSFLQTEDILINGVPFSRKSGLEGYDDKAKLTKAIIDILNGAPLQIGTEKISYLTPIETAHAAIAFKHRGNIFDQEKNMQGLYRLENDAEKAIAGYQASKNYDASPITAQLIKSLHGDIVQESAMHQRLSDMSARGVDDIAVQLLPLLNVPDFRDKLLPMALMVAFAQSGESSITDFIAHLDTHKDLVVKGFESSGIPNENATALFTLVKANTKQVKNIETILNRAVSQYAFASLEEAVQAALGRTGAKRDVQELQKDALNVLAQIPSGNSLSLRTEKSASLGIESKLIPFSGSISLGKEDGMMLSRGENGQISLVVSNSFFAKGAVAGGLSDIASVGGEASGTLQQDLTFNFADDAACASFMGQLLKGQANMASLVLCDTVSSAHGILFSAQVESSLGAEVELPYVCTVNIGASAEVGGAWSRTTSEEREFQTITTQKSFAIGITAQVQAELASEILGHAQTTKDVLEQGMTIAGQLQNAVHSGDTQSVIEGMQGARTLGLDTKGFIESIGDSLQTAEDVKPKDGVDGGAEAKDAEEGDAEGVETLDVSTATGLGTSFSLDLNGFTAQIQAGFNMQTVNDVTTNKASGTLENVSTTTSSTIGGDYSDKVLGLFAKNIELAPQLTAKICQYVRDLGLANFDVSVTRVLTSDALLRAKSATPAEQKSIFAEPYNYEFGAVNITFANSTVALQNISIAGLSMKQTIEGMTTATFSSRV